MDGQMSQIQVSQSAFVEAMRQETEQMLSEVMAAVNRAPAAPHLLRHRRHARGPRRLRRAAGHMGSLGSHVQRRPGRV